MKYYFNTMLFIVFASVSLQARDIYVSLDGDDRQKGTSASKAVKTVQKAFDLAKQIRTKNKESITIHISQGTYEVLETIVIPNTLSNMSIVGNGNVIISGAPITNEWEKVQDYSRFSHVPSKKMWRTALPKTNEGFSLVKTIYDANGDKLPRARTKGFTPANNPSLAEIHHVEKNLQHRFFDKRRSILYFKDGDISAYPDAENAELLIMPKEQWLINYLPIKEIDEQKHTLKTKISATYPMYRTFPSGALRQFNGEDKNSWGTCHSAWIENVAAAIDEPNEWIADAKEGYLYIYAPKGKPKNIRIPRTVELFRIEGESNESKRSFYPVKNITISGISFQFTDRKTKGENAIALQHDWEEYDASTAVVRLKCAENVKIKNCEFKNVGGTAVRMDLYAQKNEVSNCYFNKVGNTCVLMAGYGPGTIDVNKHNIVHNNKMHHFGDLVWHGAGVHIFQSGHNEITNNHIFDGPYNGIILSGVRGRWLPEFRGNTIHFSAYKSLNPRYQEIIDDRVEATPVIRWDEINSPKNWPEFIPFLHTRHNLVQDNELHDLVTKLGDGNGLYVSATGGSNTYKRNLIYNIRSIQPARADDDAMGDTYEQNIFVNTTGGKYSALRVKQLNSVKNNIFIYSKGPGLTLGAWWMARPAVMDKVEINNNVFVYTGHEEAPKSITVNAVANNKEYYQKLDYSLKNNLFFATHKETPKWGKTSANINENWNKNWMYQSPLFKNLEGWDLSLQNNSPLLNSGFQQIEYQKIGNREDPAFARIQKEGLPTPLGNFYYDQPASFYDYTVNK